MTGVLSGAKMGPQPLFVEGRSGTLALPRGGARGRDLALDIVKGSLVLLMVLYHWMNYFVTLSWDAYRYLRFLTPSFIFITGFLVSYVYAAKYVVDGGSVLRRLVRRGTKLLLLFIALNVAANFVREGLDTRQVSAVLYPALTSGSGTASFEILVPIAYFLALAPLFLFLTARRQVSPGWIAGVTVLTTLALEYFGFHSFNVEMLAIATLGLAAGVIDRSRIDRIAEFPVALLLSYAAYLLAITIVGTPFVLQLIGVPLSVLSIYYLAKKRPARYSQWVATLGEYSLFAYVVQVAALQMLARVVNGERDGVMSAAMLAATVAVTVGAVYVIERGRRRLDIVDSLYRLVFA